MKVERALHNLTRAREDHEAALTAQNAAFKANGQKECPEAEKASGGACERVMAAERELAAAPSQNPVDVLRKVSALIDSGMLDQTIANLKAEADRFMDAQGDRLVTLNARCADMGQMIDTGRVAGALYGDMMDKLHELEAEAVDIVPSTPAGLAAALDLYWRTEGPCSPMGTADWHNQMRNPALQMLANIRTGAQQLAGQEAD